jgi:hypothetical protein
MVPPAHSCQLLNHTRLARNSESHSRMLAPTKRLEYLDTRPRPANAPTASHQFALREA